MSLQPCTARTEPATRNLVTRTWMSLYLRSLQKGQLYLWCAVECSRLDNRLCQVPELKAPSCSGAGQNSGPRRAPSRIVHFLIDGLHCEDWPHLRQGHTCSSFVSSFGILAIHQEPVPAFGGIGCCCRTSSQSNDRRSWYACLRRMRHAFGLDQGLTAPLNPQGYFLSVPCQRNASLGLLHSEIL